MTLAKSVLDKLYTELAKFPGVATRNDLYLALSYAVRDRLLHRWVLLRPHPALSATEVTAHFNAPDGICP